MYIEILANNQLSMENECFLMEIDTRLRSGIEILSNENDFDKYYNDISRILNESNKDINQILVKNNSILLANLLTKNVSNKLIMIEKLCESKKKTLKNLFNVRILFSYHKSLNKIDFYLKELRRTNNKLKEKVFKEV